MLTWRLSQGNCFDAISIIEVKISKCPRDKVEELTNQYIFYANLIQEQIGNDKFNEVKNSIEYIKLLDSNKKIFELLDNAKHYYINSLIIDSENFRRFTLKDNLQRIHFPNSSINETKLGYTKHFIKPEN